MNNIEILEELINDYKNGVWQELPYKFNREIIEALENLIQENKELKEKYEFVINNNLDDKYEEVLEKTFKKYIDKDFIPKSKIREKIEELEKQAEEVKKHYKGTYACLDEYLNAKSKIQGYKELLEEGE